MSERERGRGRERKGGVGRDVLLHGGRRTRQLAHCSYIFNQKYDFFCSPSWMVAVVMDLIRKVRVSNLGILTLL